MKEVPTKQSLPELITIEREDGTTYKVTQKELAKIMESEDYFTLPTDRSLEGLATEIGLSQKERVRLDAVLSDEEG